MGLVKVAQERNTIEGRIILERKCLDVTVSVCGNARGRREAGGGPFKGSAEAKDERRAHCDEA